MHDAIDEMERKFGVIEFETDEHIEQNKMTQLQSHQRVLSSVLVPWVILMMKSVFAPNAFVRSSIWLFW